MVSSGRRARKLLLRSGKLEWNGVTNNFRAFLDYDANTEVTVVMVSNQMVGANDLLRENVKQIVAGESVAAPTVPQPEVVSLPAQLLESYAGQYDVAGSPMPVRARDGLSLPTSGSCTDLQDHVLLTAGLFDSFDCERERDRKALDWSGLECPRLE